MNSQQNRVNDYRALSDTVIDLRQAWLFVFIDAIVYLFAAQSLLGVLFFVFLTVTGYETRPNRLE